MHYIRLERRGFAATLTVTCLLLLLAACSSGTLAGQTTLTGAVPKAKATLTVWTFMPSEFANGTKAYNEVVQAFEQKYPQISIKLVNIPYPTYFQRVRDAAVARVGPDVITMYGGAQAYSYHNGLLPLQDAMQPAVKTSLRFISDNYSKNGNLYILPTGEYGYVLIVNQGLFRKAGINPAVGLRSWQSLLTTCRQMSAKGIQPIASGWKDGFMFETFMYMISSQLMDAGTLSKWIHGQIPVSAPLFQTAADDVVAMNKAGCFGGSSALGRNMYDDAFNQYYAGQTAMMVSGDVGTVQSAFQHVPDSTIMRLPQVPGSKYTNLIDSGAETGWAVTTWTKYPQAAGAFVNFLAGRQAQMIIWNTVGVPPNLRNITVHGHTPGEKALLPLLDNPVNHTGFEAFPLTVLAVYERNAAPLIAGTMSVATFTGQAEAAYAQSR
jgi:ABC-type glycerol-3-phosphate transport system substrate-binding protein